MARFHALKYARDRSNPRIARIVLDRPDRLNAIDERMPGEIRRAVGRDPPCRRTRERR